jgi:hypothetical protein
MENETASAASSESAPASTPETMPAPSKPKMSPFNAAMALLAAFVDTLAGEPMSQRLSYIYRTSAALVNDNVLPETDDIMALAVNPVNSQPLTPIEKPSTAVITGVTVFEAAPEVVPPVVPAEKTLAEQVIDHAMRQAE